MAEFIQGVHITTGREDTVTWTAKGNDQRVTVVSVSPSKRYALNIQNCQAVTVNYYTTPPAAAAHCSGDDSKDI